MNLANSTGLCDEIVCVMTVLCGRCVLQPCELSWSRRHHHKVSLSSNRRRWEQFRERLGVSTASAIVPVGGDFKGGCVRALLG